jgi:hypothetical protein
MEIIQNRDGPFQWDPAAGILPFSTPCTIPQLRHQTIRDQQRDIKLSYRLGFEPAVIAKQQGLTIHQVRYTLTQPAIPKKRAGRLPKLNYKQVDKLVEFVCISKENCQITYNQLAQYFRNFVHHLWDIGKDTI